MYKSTSSFYVHPGWMKLLANTAQQYGLDLGSYTSGLTLDETLDVRHIRQIHRQLITDTNDVAFPLQAAKLVNPLSLGSYSLTLWTSPDLQTLLKNAQQYCVAIGSPIRLHLNYTAQGDAELWVINHEPLNEEMHVTYVGVTLYIATLIHIIHETTDYVIKELVVKLNHWPYDEAERDLFSELTRCSIVTNAAVRKICIPSKYLPIKLTSHDAEIYANSLEALRRQAAKVEKEDIVLQVYRALDSHFLTMNITTEDVARCLSMSVRTLSRRLSVMGTSYRNILEKYKLEKAMHFLSSGEKNICEIAYLLGFSDTSTFSRAFKKWTGYTPSYVARQCE